MFLYSLDRVSKDESQCREYEHAELYKENKEYQKIGGIDV